LLLLDLVMTWLAYALTVVLIEEQLLVASMGPNVVTHQQAGVMVEPAA
jgi:hypothetical protein